MEENRVNDIRNLRVLIWGCGNEEKFAGNHIYREAKRQGLNVQYIIGRGKPEVMSRKVRELIAKGDPPHWIFNFVIRKHLSSYYDWIREKGIRQLWWYPDQLNSARLKMWNSLKGKPDAIVFAMLHNAQYLRDHAPHVLWIPQYFDAEYCKREGQLPKRLDQKKPIYDLCYLGSCDSNRKRWLAQLKRKYNCNLTIQSMRSKHRIHGWKMAEIYAQSKVAFNIQWRAFTNRKPFITSNRAYNAMGSGCFFINHYVNQVELLWQEGVHCVTYNDSYEELEAKIRYWLAPENEARREEIARAGQEDILKHHTLERRIPQYWNIMFAIQTSNTSELKDWSFEQQGRFITRKW